MIARFLIAFLLLPVAAAVWPVDGQAVEVADSLWVPDASGAPGVQVEATTDIPSLHPVFFSRRCAPGVEFRSPSGATTTECALYGQGGGIMTSSNLIKIGGVDAPPRYADGGSAIVNLLPDGAFAHLECDGGSGCYARIDPTAPKYRFNLSALRYEWTFERSAEPRVAAGAVDLRLYPISMAASKTGRFLVSVTPQHIVWIDRATGVVRQVAGAPEPGHGFSLENPLSVSPSGRYVAVGSNSWGNTLRVFDMETCSPDPRPFESTCTSVNLDDLFNESKLSFSPGRVVRIAFYGESQITFAAKTSFLPGGSDSEFRQFLMTAEGAEPPEESAAVLGDSFASGEGVQSLPADSGGGFPSEEFAYLDGTDVYDENSCLTATYKNLEYRYCDPINLCHVADQAWPDRLAFTLGLASSAAFACSGARTYDISHVTQYPRTLAGVPGFPGSEPQFSSLGRLQSPRRVFVQIGGNDAGFTDILTKCAMPNDCSADPDLRREFALRIQRAFYLVRYVLATLRQDYDHQSQIYLVGYPQIVDPAPESSCGTNVRLSAEERAFADQLLDYVDKVGQSAAGSAGVRFIRLADSIAGHQLCDPIPWVNGLTAGNDVKGTLNGLGIGNESYHPRREAHAAFANAIAAALVPPEDGNLEPDASIEAPPIPAWGSGSADVRDWSPTVDAAPGAPLMPRVRADGLEPGLPVTGYFASDPVPFAEATADAEGSLTFVPQPASPLVPGLHTLHVFATAASGEGLHARVPFLVPGDEGDVDADGFLNGEDACPLLPAESIADQGDSDGDGLGDGCDPSLVDGPTADPDADGLSNAEELAAGTDRENADSDGDGVGDGADNCPSVSNASQSDADADGIGDACDATPNGDDRDGDGVVDASDNCPDTPNPDQLDSDGDGAGDLCDPTPAGDDSDGDGVVDASDNCPGVPNPDQHDADADGVGDECDATPGNTGGCRIDGGGYLANARARFQLHVRSGLKSPTGAVILRDWDTGLFFRATRIHNLIVYGPRHSLRTVVRGHGQTSRGPVNFRVTALEAGPVFRLSLGGSITYVAEGQVQDGRIDARCGKHRRPHLVNRHAWWHAPAWARWRFR